MALDLGTSDLVKLVLSSAVVSSAINLSWNVWSKRQDAISGARKESQRVNHIYLEVALQLEAFAHRCNERVNKILVGLSYAEQFHDDIKLKNIASVHLKFDPDPEWSALPVEFAARLKILPKQFAASHDWIMEAYEDWAATDEALNFEVERLSYFGKIACDHARSVRMQIGAGDGQIQTVVEMFEHLIDSKRKEFKADQNADMIPELKKLFISEQSAA